MKRSIILSTIVWVSLAFIVSSCCTLANLLNPNNLPAQCAPPQAGFIANQTTIMQGGQVNFTDQSIGNNISSWEWTFTGGSPARSSDRNPVITYSSAGTYSVSLKVINPNGEHIETKTGYIIVLERLNANFSANVRTIQTGQNVRFTDNSSGGGIVSRNWSFEGGSPNTSSGLSPVVTYNQAGTYPVELRLANSLGDTDSERKTSYIQVRPGVRTIEFQPNNIIRKCPSHVEGDRDFKGHGPNVSAWAQLRVVDNQSVYVDYYIRARETRQDWTTAEGQWSDLLWTAPNGNTIMRITSAIRSETSYRDTDHELDVPAVNGGNLVRRFEIMGDTGGNDVGNCTDDDVYLNIYFNEVQIEIQPN